MSETTGMNPVTAFGISDDYEALNGFSGGISDDHEALRPKNDGISDGHDPVITGDATGI